MQSQSFVRTVERPDLLLVAAFLHDIGKCQEGDHSEIGAEMTRVMAPRMAFDSTETEILERLVLHHLLLPDIATKRDLDDPEVILNVASKVRDTQTLDLLLALSLADSRATGPSLRSRWREGLLRDLAARVRLHLNGGNGCSNQLKSPIFTYELLTTMVFSWKLRAKITDFA
jgi:[protein-PII] uridylyltransferase